MESQYYKNNNFDTAKMIVIGSVLYIQLLKIIGFLRFKTVCGYKFIKRNTFLHTYIYNIKVEFFKINIIIIEILPIRITRVQTYVSHR